jgi:uncharacterized damage-inducible protein DinB
VGLATYFGAQAYNNRWANHRLLNAVSNLSQQEIEANRSGFFPSIIHTLNHILTVDWFYVSALEGNCVGYAAFEPEIPFSQFAELDKEQRSVDRRLIAFCEGRKDFTEHVRLVRDTWEQVEPVDRVLLHLFQHQIHHRGQIHAMLSGTRVAPPQLDEFFLGHDKQRELRREDFAELGYSENHIWR